MRVCLFFSLLLGGCAHGAALSQCQSHARSLPAAWQLVQCEGAQAGYYNPQLRAVIETNTSCRADSDVAPLETLTRHLLIGYSDRRVVSEERVSLGRRDALHLVVEAKLD